jgi:hypothetical protein
MPNSEGCDSVVTLHLTLHQSSSTIDYQTSCDSLFWHDSTYTASTYNTQFITHNSEGCDSVVTLHLTLHQSSTTDDYQTACDQFIWHDSTYTASTNDAHFSTINSFGCDSTVTLYLTLNNSVYDTLIATANDSYTWQGNTYTASGQYTYQGQTVEGCDSIVTLILTINTTQGIDPVDIAQLLSVYPNPTAGPITVAGIPIRQIEVYDNQGRLVKQITTPAHPDSFSLDLSALPAGTYLLRLVLQPANGDAFVTLQRVIKR